MITLKDFIEDVKYYLDTDEEIIPSSTEDTIKSLERLFIYVRDKKLLRRVLHRIVNVINEKCISEEIFDFLLSNKLFLRELSNMDLNNLRLLRILEIDKSNCELLKKIAKNYLDDRYTINDFSLFIDDFDCSFILHYLLYRIIKDEKFGYFILEKGKYLSQYIIDSRSSERAVFSTACCYKDFFDDLKKDKPVVLEENKTYSYLQLLALFYNPKQNLRINYVTLRNMRIKFFEKEELKIEKLRLKYINGLNEESDENTNKLTFSKKA